MMPGNYARMLFDPKKESVLVEQITDASRQGNMCGLLDKFCFMRKIYRDRKSNQQYPVEVAQYKCITIKFGETLIEHYPHVRLNSYTNKVIEHVSEIIEPDELVGHFQVREMIVGTNYFVISASIYSRKYTIQSGLENINKIPWLYCSKTLQDLADVVHKKYECGTKYNYGVHGHNRLTCTIYLLTGYPVRSEKNTKLEVTERSKVRAT